MAKRHHNEEPKSDESSDVLPAVEPVEEQKPQLPLWSIRRKAEAGEPQLVEAETLEDAIRAFNGASGMCGPNDLTVERV
jgi:hypothetical protein